MKGRKGFMNEAPVANKKATRQGQNCRPMIFNALMVRAILEGRKTQTRRVIKPQPNENGFWRHGTTAQCDDCGDHFPRAPRKCQCGCTLFKSVEYPITKCLRDCPYGQPSDQLYVRETWKIAEVCAFPSVRSVTVEYKADDAALYRYECDHERLFVDDWKPGSRWSSPLHMPRWASRITLEIMGVRVERLQEISEEDAKAEGCEYQECGRIAMPKRSHVAGFAALWDSINGVGAWDTNPFVWVLEFKAVNPTRQNTSI